MSSKTRQRYLAEAVSTCFDLYERALLPCVSPNDRELSLRLLTHELDSVKDMMEEPGNYQMGCLPAHDITRTGHKRFLVSTICLYLQTTLQYRLENGPKVKGLTDVGLVALRDYFGALAVLSESAMFHRNGVGDKMLNMDGLTEFAGVSVMHDFTKTASIGVSVQGIAPRHVPHLSSGPADVLSIEMHRRMRAPK